MWTKVIPFLPFSLYISYKTIYFHNILIKSFLMICNFFELLVASIYDLNTMEILDVTILYDYIVRFGEKIKLCF
jgi:hypothetical protein